jgi:hypothetical protein
MGFLIRVAFWLGLVLVLIPRPEGTETTADINPLQVVSTTAAIFGDLAGLCDRQPQVCDSAGEIMRAVGLRARDGAAIAYSALTSVTAGEDGHEEDAMATGSVRVGEAEEETER